MSYTLTHIASILHHQVAPNNIVIEHLLLDSRKLYQPDSSVFFAIANKQRDAHQFIPELYQKGVRAFIVSSQIDDYKYEGAIFIKVENVINALQQIAAYHRKQFSVPVIAITGKIGRAHV